MWGAARLRSFVDARRTPSLARLLAAAIVGATLTVAAAPAASAASPTLAVLSASSFAVGKPSSSVRIADVTGDGLRDLITSRIGATSAVAVFPQQPDHTLGAAVPLAVDGTSPALLLATGDLNGDGATDLAASTDAGVDVWLQASGSLGTATLIATSAPVHGVAIADLNGDTFGDLVWAQESATGYDYEVAYQNGTHTLDAPVTIGTGGAPTFAVGDVDDDGRADLVLEDPTAAGVDELLQTSAGVFTSGLDTGVLGASSADVGDVNGDSVPDLVTTGGDDLEVQTGDGSGGLSAPTSYPVSWGSVASVAVADLNGDGHPDVVAAGTWSTRVLLQTAGGALVGGGDWAPLGISPAGGDAGLAIGDLNGDGLRDLVAASTTNQAGRLTQLGPGQTLTSSLSITPSTTSITGGQHVTLTGTLTLETNYLGTPTVSIHEKLPDGTTSVVATPSLTAVSPGLGFGTFTYTADVQPAHSGTLRYWASWATDGASADATSPKVSIGVTKSPTSTALATSATRIRYGRGAALTATVQGGAGGSVTFYRVLKGTRKKIATVALGGTGVAKHRVQPKANSTYLAVYGKSALAKSSTSNTVTVQVQVKITSGMVRKKSTDGAYAVYDCCKAFYSFAVAPNHAGASVTANVEYRAGSTWTGLGSQPFTLRKDSSQVIYIKIGGGKGYRFRVKACFPSDKDHVGACSAYSYFYFK
jgi:hypothetical protein